MNGRKDNDVEIEKDIESGKEERIYESYEPTTNELDDDNPPSEDSDSSDSDSSDSDSSDSDSSDSDSSDSDSE